MTGPYAEYLREVTFIPTETAQNLPLALSGEHEVEQ